MTIIPETYDFLKDRGCLVFITLLLSLLPLQLYAQEPPPRPLQVTLDQNIGFGAFTHGPSGGTVIISSAGLRTATGDVILLNLGIPFSAAMFSMIANPGTVVSVLLGYDVLLAGSSGGAMTLRIDTSSPVSPIVISTNPPASTTLYLGGSLTVGNSAANPPGNYSGTFNVTFIQE